VPPAVPPATGICNIEFASTTPPRSQERVRSVASNDSNGQSVVQRQDLEIWREGKKRELRARRGRHQTPAGAGFGGAKRATLGQKRGRTARTTAPPTRAAATQMTAAPRRGRPSQERVRSVASNDSNGQSVVQRQDLEIWREGKKRELRVGAGAARTHVSKRRFSL